MRCKDTNFSRHREIKFGRVGKSAYLCIRFHKEIVEALYLRLANENLRNFHRDASKCNGFARISVGCCLHLYLKVFSGPSFEEVVYGTTLLLLYSSSGCGRANKN